MLLALRVFILNKHHVLTFLWGTDYACIQLHEFFSFFLFLLEGGRRTYAYEFISVFNIFEWFVRGDARYDVYADKDRFSQWSPVFYSRLILISNY